MGTLLKHIPFMYTRNKLPIFSLIMLLIAVFGSCNREKNKDFLQITGSDTMLQLTQKLSTQYIKKYPKKNIALEGGGSGRGIASLLNRLTDIANASRKIKTKETNLIKKRNQIVYEIPIARDGIVIIVNPQNPIKSISIEQMSLIYQNKITNWSTINPSYLKKILVIARDNNSGTHEYFKNTVIKQGIKSNQLKYGHNVSYAVSSQQILDQISQNPKAIGYISLGWPDKRVKIVSIIQNNEIIKPSFQNVQTEKYPLSRSLYMYVFQESYPKVESFINFIFSKEGKSIIEEIGFIPVHKKVYQL